MLNNWPVVGVDEADRSGAYLTIRSVESSIWIWIGLEKKFGFEKSLINAENFILLDIDIDYWEYL